MLNQLRSLNFEELPKTLKRVDQVIKVNLGSQGGLKAKMNLVLLRWNLRKEVVLKMENLHVSLV